MQRDALAGERRPLRHRFQIVDRLRRLNLDQALEWSAGVAETCPVFWWQLPVGNPALPDVPTVSEGLPGYDTASWFGWFAPAGTPPAVLQKIAADALRVLAQSGETRLAAVPDAPTARELAGVRDVVKELAIPGLNTGAPITWGIPSVGIANYSGIGDDSEGPYENKNNSMQFLNNTSWVHGKHTFRFGGEVRRDAVRRRPGRSLSLSHARAGAAAPEPAGSGRPGCRCPCARRPPGPRRAAAARR